MSWRTNRRTKNRFPVEDRWGNKLPDESPEPEPIEEESGKGVNVVAECGGCGKPLYEGAQMYELDGVVICQTCNRVDNRLSMQERLQNPQPTVPDIPYAPSSGGSGRHRGGSPSCSKCGHVYSLGESHEDHWRQHPD